VIKIGDITCRVCGEPWDAYGVYHGDMTPAEKTTFLKGKGCPTCGGNPNKCEVGDEGSTICDNWESGRCKSDKPCTYKQRQQPRLEGFLHTLTSNSDEDPIKLLNNVFLG